MFEKDNQNEIHTLKLLNKNLLREKRTLQEFLESDCNLNEFIKSKTHTLKTNAMAVFDRPGPIERSDLDQDLRAINYITEELQDIVNNWEMYYRIHELKQLQIIERINNINGESYVYCKKKSN